MNASTLLLGVSSLSPHSTSEPPLPSTGLSGHTISTPSTPKAPTPFISSLHVPETTTSHQLETRLIDELELYSVKNKTSPVWPHFRYSKKIGFEDRVICWPCVWRRNKLRSTTFGPQSTVILKKEDTFSRTTATGPLQTHLIKEHKIRLNDDIEGPGSPPKRQRLLGEEKMPSSLKAKVDQDLFDLILECNLPLTIVRHRALRRLVKNTHPSYSPPSLETLHKQINDRASTIEQQVGSLFTLSFELRGDQLFCRCVQLLMSLNGIP